MGEAAQTGVKGGMGLLSAVQQAKAQRQQGKDLERAGRVEKRALKREARDEEIAARDRSISRRKELNRILSDRSAANAVKGVSGASVSNVAQQDVAEFLEGEETAAANRRRTVRGLGARGRQAEREGEAGMREAKFKSRSTLIKGLKDFGSTLPSDFKIPGLG
ncbi:MAG: hypothetical protein KAJ19_08520 [Gammaproteobacteria bacterium]|nr:hypothetical protein [Gammaproteobacteria bacterium]